MMSVGSVVSLIWKCIFYYGNTSFVVSILATVQEYKVWKKTSSPMNVIGILKCYALNICWMWGCLLLLLIMTPTWILRGFKNKCVSNESHGVIESTISKFLIATFVGRVEVKNAHHLPPTTKDGEVGPVFVANHITTFDAPSVYLVLKNHPFTWIFKKSILLLPGVGPVMYLSKHIMIDRKKKNSSSIQNLYDQSNATIQSGRAMFVFPQGTRKYTHRLPFKDGAFTIALSNKAPIVPISIDVPLHTWNTILPKHTITLTIHKPIPTTDKTNKEELKQEVSDIIYSALPPVPLAPIQPRKSKQTSSTTSDKKTS